jgi:hypothetical protein
MSVGGGDDGTRWAARPTLARVLRVVVFASPVVAAVGVSSLAALTMGAAGSRAEQAWHLAVLLACSTATLLVVDRVARRALPLATLLELSMLFPDRAPSRLAVAREAIRKRSVEDQLARVSDAGADPGIAAREILGLVAALRAHDRPTRGHAERVRMLTDLVSEAMNISERDRDLLRWAAILHDIGKLRVPPAILNKPGKPTDDEWAVLRAHPMHGAQIAGALLPWLGEWGKVIVEHHERYDGTGYPMGLAGREISLGGRVVAVADAYEVMTAARAYRRPISRVAAHRELVKWSGQQFDPAVVRAMVGLSAPRLRRAQGLIAWISDIPLVATSYVPAATVARVVGVGALASGAATGVALPSAALPANFSAPHVNSVTSTSPSGASGSANTSNAQDSAGGVGGPSNEADHSRDLDGVAVPPAAPIVGSPAASQRGHVSDAVPSTTGPDPEPAPEKSASSDSGSGDSGSGDSGSGDSGSGDSGSGDSGSGNSGSGNSGSGNSGSGNSGSGNSGSGSSVVTTVTSALGAVTTAVDDTVVALTGVLGSGSHGSGRGGSSGSGSGSSGSGSGSSGSGSGSSGSGTGAPAGPVDVPVDTATGTVPGVVDTLGGLLGSGKKKK